MAFIDCASWKPQNQNGEFVFAYRYPETNLSTFTQLIVAESQEAFLFSKGQMMSRQAHIELRKHPSSTQVIWSSFWRKQPIYCRGVDCQQVISSQSELECQQYGCS